MSLEQAMEKYAAALESSAEALNKHTEVMERVLAQGVIFVTASTDNVAPADASAGKPEPAKRGRKPKEEPKVETTSKKEEEVDDFNDDDTSGADDFNDDDTGTQITAEQIKELLFKVKDKKGADVARSILGELGVKTIAQIPEASFNKAISLAAKAGVKL